MSLYFRTYFNKDNTIVKDSTVNLGANPIAELFYGGTYENPEYSRYIFQFSVERLRDLYNNCQLGDLSQVKHKLVLKPTRFLGTANKNDELCLATSYELCLFRVRQEWEEGCGYDFDCACLCDGYISPNCNNSNGASNWYYAETNVRWNTDGVFDTFSGNTIITEDPVFSGEPVYLMCKKQECNDCLFELDMTSLVNDLITGDTPNYGFGLAFNNFYEINPQGKKRYIGFYSSETPNFFKPYIETEYLNPIQDDRGSFYLDKPNNLYLYVNLRGEPTNLDVNPIVTIYDEFDDPFITLTGECVTQGVYGVNFTVPSSGVTEGACLAWRDVWSNIRIQGRTRPDAEMEFEILPDTDYYQVGFGTYTPKKYGFKFRGIRRNESIQRGDVRKIVVDIYEQFKPNRRIAVDNVYYRIYVKEGMEQLDVVPWTPVNIGACENFIYLYTEWMIPQQYYIDFKAISNQEERTYPEEIKFTILDDEEVC